MSPIIGIHYPNQIPKLYPLVIGFTIFIIIGIFSSQAQAASAAAITLPCETPGWFPEDFGVKDHTVFRYDEYYYIAANHVPGEKYFAYARSTDLCEWEELEPILGERIADTWNELAVWSPYVFIENDIYYLFFTGVTNDFTQSILLATTTNPADPQSWEIEDMVFQPNHPGSKWKETGWADCRDPMMLKNNGVYYLYYVGADEEGGIVGVATAASPQGEWTDWGSIIPPVPDTMPESPTLYFHDHFYYLFYHLSGQGETYRIGASVTGPWNEPMTLYPGWAHEVWDGHDEVTYTSFLTDYSITISPLSWNPYTYPPQPFIGSQVYRILLPIVFN